LVWGIEEGKCAVMKKKRKKKERSGSGSELQEATFERSS